MAKREVMIHVRGDMLQQARLSYPERIGPDKELDNKVTTHGRAPRYGGYTLEWLSEKIGLAEKTLRNLEKGKGTYRTLKTVCDFLKIERSEYVLGQGAACVSCKLNDSIDFRPQVPGWYPTYSKTYSEYPFFVTLDPILINSIDDLSAKTQIDNIVLTVQVDKLNLDFEWLYRDVLLTSEAKTWLGDGKPIVPFDIARHEKFSSSIMFKQIDGDPASWGEFINLIRHAESEYIYLTVKLLSYFDKTIEYKLSVHSILKTMESAERKFGLSYVYRFQEPPTPVLV